MKRITTVLAILIIGTGLLALPPTITAVKESNVVDRGTTTTWSGNCTLTSDYVVAFEDVLIIEPGVTVYLDEGINIFVEGGLKAEGTETNRIIFTHKDPGEYWGCICFNYSIKDSIIDHCIIEYGTNGIQCNNGFSTTISNNTIRLNNGDGIYAICPSCEVIMNNTITLNKGDGIDYWYKASPLIINNLITGNGGAGVHCADQSSTITANDILYNRNGVYSAYCSPTISDNNISYNSECGISCWHNGHPYIYNNQITYNGKGISTNGADYSTVFNNVIADNNYGIYSGSYPHITNNTIYNNTKWGICVVSGIPSIGDNNFLDAYPNGEGRVLKQWTLRMDIKDEYYNYVTGATIVGVNCFGTEEWKETASSYYYKLVTEYKIFNNGTKITYTPYIFYIYKEGVGASSVTVAGSTTELTIFLHPAPDLLIVADSITFSSWNPIVGDVIIVNVTIDNIGEVNASCVNISFFVDEIQIEEVQIDTILVGGNSSTSVNWVATSGNHTIKIKVDQNNSILEANEDNNEQTKEISVQVDTDGDKVPDSEDEDDDNDGYPDADDTFPLDGNEWFDTDNDGIGNNADEDDDNDGYLDTVEMNEGTDPLDSTSIPADLDGDYIPDSMDNDIDGDGYLNVNDTLPNDPNEWEDTDGDGVGDNSDVFPNDPSEWKDTDNDGVGDNSDAYPNDPTKWELEEEEEEPEKKEGKGFIPGFETFLLLIVFTGYATVGIKRRKKAQPPEKPTG